VRNTFALHGSSTQQRPLNERGRGLIQVQLRPTRYWATADSHDDGKFTRRVGSRTNGLRRRQPSSQTPLLGPGPLRTGRETFASSGSSPSNASFRETRLRYGKMLAVNRVMALGMK
jgi:hypothetical protein